MVRLLEMLRQATGVEVHELVRRYFINTLFDSTFVVLGILAASAFAPEANPEIAIGTLLAACLAIGISTAVSVYEAEHIEAEIKMQKVESAMLTSMEDTEVERRTKASALAIAGVNFLAPVFVAAVMGAPLLLYELGIISDFGDAATISSALGIGIIFAAGYYIGTLGKKSPWVRALRMSVVALLAFGALLLFERAFL